MQTRSCPGRFFSGKGPQRDVQPVERAAVSLRSLSRSSTRSAAARGNRFREWPLGFWTNALEGFRELAGGRGLKNLRGRTREPCLTSHKAILSDRGIREEEELSKAQVKRRTKTT